MRATISWLALTPLLYPPVPTPSGSPTCEPVSIAPIRCIRHHGRRSYQRHHLPLIGLTGGTLARR
jgi:hypothetical protein